MTATLLATSVALALAAGTGSETVTYEAYALRAGGKRELLARGARTYSAACDIHVRALGTTAWNKSLDLDDAFSIGASVHREVDLTGFGLTVDRAEGRDGFSWDWFDLAHDNVFEKLQGTGRVAVETTKGPGYVELQSVEFLEDVTLRFLDDMSKAPGTHTHEVVVRKGSVLRLAPTGTTPASPCPPPAVTATAKTPPQAPQKMSEIQTWLTYYYLKPRPERTLESLDLLEAELQKGGSSLADLAARGGLRSFYAAILARNDAVAADVVTKLPTFAPGRQAFLREVLDRCGTAACGRTGTSAPTPTRQPDPASLDDNWGAFFATGEAKYVHEIVAVLPWSEVRGDVDRLVTGGAARWSLSSNAYQHARVLAILEESLRTASGSTKVLLQQLVDEAKAERARNPPPIPFR